MRVRPRMPATERDSQEVCTVSADFCLISSGMPGTCLSMASIVASGVKSKGDSPVPPVVTTRSHDPSSHQDTSFSVMTARSSGATA